MTQSTTSPVRIHAVTNPTERLILIAQGTVVALALAILTLAVRTLG